MVSGFDNPALSATAETAMLNEQEKDALALQLSWNIEEIQLSGGYSGDSGPMRTTVQFSHDEGFSTVARRLEVSGASLSYTHGLLNDLVLALGFEPDETQTLYVRIETQLSANVAPQHSNVLGIAITAYAPSAAADYLYMATSAFSASPWTLCSPLEDGRHAGFAPRDP